MSNYNSWHPMPRYGLAATFVHLGEEPSSEITEQQLKQMASKALKLGLNHFMLEPFPSSSPGMIHYKYMPSSRLEPGSKSGQVAANGYYSGPHVITGNNAGDITKEIKNLIVLLDKGDTRAYELKRSFAPMIAKLNAGKASMSNPRVPLIQAAFTAVATLTTLKPSAYPQINTGLFPDLPFLDEEARKYPLYEFVLLFGQLQSQGLGKEAYTQKLEGDKYRRPSIFQGNYPEAPRSLSLGAVPLISAIGQWVNKHDILLFDKAQSTLNWLKNRPIYVVSYDGSIQERFHHHLVNMALQGDLYSIVKDLPKVQLIGIEDGKKFQNNNWKLFLIFLNQFLRFFNPSSWNNFLAFRATYPSTFYPLLKSYFMHTGNYDEILINSAVSYGQSLNRAAYIAARQETKGDQVEGIDGRSLKEYKHRVLLQLESIIQSAQSGSELVARLNAQVGRLTMQDIDSAGKVFLVAVTNEQIPLLDAQHLITAFMRLSTFHHNQQGDNQENRDSIITDESVLDI